MTINISSINLNYGEVQILKNIDFRIEPGKVVSIVGPNGAGKSSLLNVISGNVEPSSGEIFYNNVPLKEITIMERAAIRSVMGQHNHVVYDFQKLALHDAPTTSLPLLFLLQDLLIQHDFLLFEMM